MQLFIKTSIFTVGFLLCSTVIFAEKADKKYTFPLSTLEDYDQAIHLDPHSTRAHHNRGVAKKKLGQYQSAIKDYNQAIRLDPDNAQAYYKRGVTHMIYCYKMMLD